MNAEVAALRNRASRCRMLASKYGKEIGPSLGNLALELDRRADTIEARDAMAAATDKPGNSR